MPADEYRAWADFFVLYPFDDFHRYHRPAALVSASMGHGDLMPAINSRLKFLQPDPPSPEELSGLFSESDLRTLRALGGAMPEVK